MSFIFVDLMGLHGTVSPNNSNTKSRTVSYSVIFVHFVDQSLLVVHQENMTRDNIPILPSYKRSERISSQMAATIPHVGVSVSFYTSRADSCVSNERLHKGNLIRAT